MAKSVSILSMESELESLLSVLSKKDQKEAEAFLAVLTEAAEGMKPENGEKVKPLWTKAAPEAYVAFTTTTLTEEEAAEIEKLQSEISGAKEAAKEAEEGAIESTWKANLAKLSKASTVEAFALQATQAAKTSQAIVVAREPHETAAEEKAAEVWELESKKLIAAKEAFRKPFVGSGRTIERRLTIPFNGMWTCEVSKARGLSVYLVGNSQFYHRANGADAFLYMGTVKHENASAFQRLSHGMTDVRVTDYSSDVKDQKEAFKLAVELIEEAEKLSDLKVLGDYVKEDGSPVNWSNVGGSAGCKHVTYTVTNERYDLDAQAWRKRNPKLPKKISEYLDGRKPKPTAEEAAELSAVAKKKAAET